MDRGTAIHLGKKYPTIQPLYHTPVATHAPQSKPIPLFEWVCARCGNWFVTYGECALSGTMRYWVRSPMGTPTADYSTRDAAIEDAFGRVLNVVLATPTPFD